VDLTATEVRVVGCLIEKQRTTPDAYPLSVNSLRLACNQTTNRDPVVSYDEEEIRVALARLRTRGWTRLAGAGRASKYRHLIDEKLGLDDGEMALMCVLMLRGDQTPGELKQRTDRLHPFADLDAVGDGLRRLIERGLAVRHERRPGQKEDRYAHTLSDDADEPVAAASAPTPAPATVAPPAPAPVAPPPPRPPAEDGYARLRDEVARLSAEVDALRARLDDLGA
jgi:uncharacterized protein